MAIKEYRLAAWPELRPPHHRIAYRRMANAMSHRHMTVWELVNAGGLRRLDVENFIEHLRERGVLAERPRARRSLAEVLQPLAAWLRRSWRAAID